MAGKGKGKKKEKEPKDKFTNMEEDKLIEFIQKTKEQIKEVKVKRNFVQQERDMITEFYEISKQEEKKLRDACEKEEIVMDHLQREHQNEINAFINKYRHLEYDHELFINEKLPNKSQEALDKEEEIRGHREDIYMQKKQELKDNIKTNTVRHDTPGFWKEDNLQKKINFSYESDESPLMSLPPISRFTLSHKSEIIPELDKNENLLNYDNNIDAEKMKEISKVEDLENDIKYQNNMKRRIKICKLEAPQIFGYMEPFELKRRFCNIRCETNEAEIQKIPFIEFLQLMPKDKKNRFLLEEFISKRKRELIEQLKNGTLAKLSFNYKKPQMKAFDIYPSRNLDKTSSNKSKLLVRSKSIILNQSEKHSTVSNYQKLESETNETNNKNNYEEPKIKIRSNILYGFKKTLFAYSEKNTKEELQYLMGVFHNKKRKKEILNNIKLGGNNSVRMTKYLSQQSVTNILPSKFSLVPHPEPVGKNYIDYSNRRFISKININSKLLLNDGNQKTEEKNLPRIDTKKRSLSLKGIQFQSLEKIRRKNKKNQSLLYRKKIEKKDDDED